MGLGVSVLLDGVEIFQVWVGAWFAVVTLMCRLGLEVGFRGWVLVFGLFYTDLIWSDDCLFC